jgi:protoheme IX farnesyltransferase
MSAISPLSELHRPVEASLAPTPTLLRDLYELTKPRMNMLVVLTTLLGCYAAPHSLGMNWVLILNTVIATALTAASAGVLNQYIEREYDGYMYRTAQRALPAGRIDPLFALALGVLLGTAGITYLALAVNPLTALLGGTTLASYVFIYTPMKRWTTLNTIIGAIPGAIPPVMGWTAMTNSLSVEAAALFAILFIWQMPHFLAIAMMYEDDYSRGGFKMLPCVDPGHHSTARQIVIYSLSLLPISLMPVYLNMAGTIYFVIAILLGLGFIYFGLRLAMDRNRPSARRLFLASIAYLPLLLIVLALDKQ